LTATVAESRFSDSRIEEFSMSTKSRIGAAGAVVMASALLLQGAAASADDGDHGHRDRVTLTFDVETGPFDYTDLGDPGPSAADVIVFYDRLFARGHRVGHEVGSCTVVEASGRANCTGVVTLRGRGSITFAFENAPPPRKILAVTGGTGAYRTAQGDGSFVESGHQTGTLKLRLVLD
jgi:hypothetical protein